MSLSRVLSFSLGAFCAASVVAQDAQVVEASFSLADAKSPVGALTRSASLTAKVPNGVTLPKDLHGAMCGTFLAGKKTVVVAVGSAEEGAENADLIYLDLDGDGKLGDDEKSSITVTTSTRGNQTMSRSAPVDVEFNFGSGAIAAKASMMKMGESGQVSVAFPGFLSASFKLGDAERTLAVVDEDFDGAMGSAGDLWVVGRADGRPQQAYGMMAMGEHCFEDGNLVGIKVNGSKIEITTKSADGPLAKDLEGQRERAEKIWSDRFDLEREGFVTQRKLDTSRKLAATPIDWHYCTFAEGMEMAKKSKKLLFVDVMAFWCVWCYRMDYYSYPDAEVAKFMNDNFIPVKIIQEQDRAGDYDAVMKGKLNAKGIPAMGVFDAEGNLLHSIGGWKSPEDFLKELKDGKGKAGN